MFTTRRIGPKSKDLGKIKQLYYDAFPENERFSFSMMIKNESGNYETFGFYKDLKKYQMLGFAQGAKQYDTVSVSVRILLQEQFCGTLRSHSVRRGGTFADFVNFPDGFHGVDLHIIIIHPKL